MVRLLEDPWRVLPRYILPCTHQEAHDYLTRRLETATLLAVCHRFVPEASGKLVPFDQDQLVPDPGQPYSPGELACLELIEAHLFPFALEYLQMCADEGERPVNIPLHSFGIDIWNLSYEHDTETWAGWLMLALLNQNFSLEQYRQMYDRSLDDCVLEALKDALFYIRETWSYEALDRVCASAPEPLCYLGTAIRMLDHATNNLFLDPGEEESVDDATWCMEDIELLTGEWREAQVMMDQAHHLVTWLTAHPTEFRKVVDLWNLALWNMSAGMREKEAGRQNSADPGVEDASSSDRRPNDAMSC